MILLIGNGNPIEGFHNYSTLQNGPAIAAQKEREITIVGDYLGAKTLIYSGGTTHSYYTVYYVPVYVEASDGNNYAYASISEATYLNYKKNNGYSWSKTPLNLDGLAVNTISDPVIYEAFLEWAKSENIKINTDNKDGLDLFNYGVK